MVRLTILEIVRISKIGNSSTKFAGIGNSSNSNRK